MLQYGPILVVVYTMKANKRISQDISQKSQVYILSNYWGRFIEYPHYPIACCLPHLRNLFTKIS